MLARKPRLWKVVGGAALTLVVGLTLAGCDSPPKGRPKPSPPVALAPTEPSTPNPSESAANSALAAYRGMWNAYIETGRTTDQANSQLDRYAEGDALGALKAGLEFMKEKGLITQGNITMAPQVTALVPAASPDTVEIVDCLDSAQSSLVKATPGGDPYVDPPGGRRKVTATAKSRGGEWKIVTVLPLDVGTC